MRKTTILKILFGVTILEGLIALIWLLRIPGDPKSAWLFGFSIERIAMFLAVIIGLIALVILFFKLVLDERWGTKLVEKIQGLVSSSLFYNLILVFTGLIAAAGIITFLLFLNELTDELWQARLTRLMPVIFWATLVNFQVLLLAPLFRGQQSQIEYSFHLDRDVWRTTGIVLISVSVIVLFVSITRIGLDPIGDWETIGVPLSFMQINLALFIALASLFVGNQLLHILPKWLAGYWKEILLAVIIWGIGIIAWQAVPMKPTFNAPKPGPPNYEYYPHSGAAYQDAIAQNLIIGEGYKLDNENEKPLYALFLACLHLIEGQDYERVVNLQIVFTALFPVVLYFFGRLGFNRITGIMFAVLAIMRERNALILMNEFDISHSKLLLTDMPGTMILSIFILISFLWLLKFPRNRQMALASGCLLGFSMLIRNQTLILILVIVIMLFILLQREWKILVRDLTLFSLGTLLVVTPWLTRNYLVTGHLFTVLPDKGRAVVQRFRMDSDLVPRYDDLTTMGEGVNRLIQFSLEHPGDMAEFLTAHFLHNEVSTILTLPVSFTSCCSISSYVEDNPFWGSWDGEGLIDSIIPIAVNIFLIALGIGVAWKTHGIVGLYPLFIHILHNLSSIVWGISGWRFILPVDWIGILYYCIGLVYIASAVFSFYIRKSQLVPEASAFKLDSMRGIKTVIWILIVIVLVIGITIPVAEHIFPQRYEKISTGDAKRILEEKLSQMNAVDGTDLASLSSDPTIEAYVGRDLYPRYYQAGKGEPGTAFRWPAHTTRDYNRLGFYLVGPDNWSVVLPLEESPEFFPNAQDVLVFGCQVDNYLIAQAVLFLNFPGELYTSSLPCSYFE